VLIVCHNLGPPSHQFSMCNATMWLNEKSEKSQKAVTPTIEEQWLNWTRNNQDTLRVDLYHNLYDAVTRGDTSVAGLGKRIVLPQTYVGSPRGAQSFTGLKMVNKINYASLMNDDKEWTHAIAEARGTGKTFLYKTIIARLRSKQMIVLAVASSSIASLLLPAGRTAHSRFVIPLELMENNACSTKQGTHLAKLLQHVRLIIWDEAPMTQRYAFEALDKMLQDILGYKNKARRNHIFGGITILLGGDFRQILPVIPYAKRPEIVTETYPNFTLRQGDDEYIIERAILTPSNDDADVINDNMFKKLGGALVTYNSADKICKASTDTVDQHDLYPVEFLNSLNFQGMP
nr:ATP-dependent DNA helicase PIF1-like [Tanacetum cinerariifolium]